MTLPLRTPANSVGLAFLKFGMGEAAARLVAFGATVYLARTLGASSYGVIVLALAMLLYLQVIADCGVEALGVRDVAEAPDQIGQRIPDVLGSRLLVAVIVAGLNAVLALTLLPDPEGAILAAFGAVLLPMALGTRWAHLGLEQSGYASLSRILTEVVAALVVVLAVRRPADLGVVPLAQLLGEAVGAFVLLRLLPRAVRTAPAVIHPETARRLLARSWPLIAHAVLGLAIFNSDLIVLRLFRTPADVGHYAAAYTLISFFLNLGAAYTLTLLPVLTRLRHDGGAAQALYHGAIGQVLAGALPMALGGFLVAGPLVTLIFGADFLPAAAPLGILVWCVPVAVIRNVAQAALVAHERQDRLLHTVAWAAALNLALNFLLIPAYGLIGAAIATVATEVVRTGIAAGYAWNLGLRVPAPWRFGRTLIAVGVMTGSLVLLGHRSAPVLVLAGATTYLAALTVVGGLRFRRGELPELVP